MTVDDELEQGERPDPAAAALARHVRSMRRQRRWYFAAVGAVAAAAVAVVLVVWFSGEITHVHLRTAATPAPSVALGTPAPQPALAWQNADATAIGAPFAGGTVVTYSAHSVTGRNALTGAALWSYTRSDRTLCTAAQTGGDTVAIYEHDGNCDEVTTLDTATGKRQWDRTLTDNGHPTYQINQSTLLVISDAAVHAIDPAGGLDRWDYLEPAGCDTRSAVLGTAGTLISQQCADGPHLLLHDPNAGDDSKDPKPIRWQLSNTDTVPAAADSFVGALDPSTNELVTYDPANGKVAGRTALHPAPTTIGPVGQVAPAQGELIWTGGTAYAFGSSGAQQWATPVAGLPTVTPTDGGTTAPQLGDAIVLAPTSSGVASLDGATGKVKAEYPVPAPPPGSRIYPLGNGFLVAGSSTAVYR